MIGNCLHVTIFGLSFTLLKWSHTLYFPPDICNSCLLSSGTGSVKDVSIDTYVGIFLSCDKPTNKNLVDLVDY